MISNTTDVTIRSSGHINKRVRKDFSAEVVHKLRSNNSRISQKKMRGRASGPAQERPWELY